MKMSKLQQSFKISEKVPCHKNINNSVGNLKRFVEQNNDAPKCFRATVDDLENLLNTDDLIFIDTSLLHIVENLIIGLNEAVVSDYVHLLSKFLQALCHNEEFIKEHGEVTKLALSIVVPPTRTRGDLEKNRFTFTHKINEIYNIFVSFELKKRRQNIGKIVADFDINFRRHLTGDHQILQWERVNLIKIIGSDEFLQYADHSTPKNPTYFDNERDNAVSRGIRPSTGKEVWNSIVNETLQDTESLISESLESESRLVQTDLKSDDHHNDGESQSESGVHTGSISSKNISEDASFPPTTKTNCLGSIENVEGITENPTIIRNIENDDVGLSASYIQSNFESRNRSLVNEDEVSSIFTETGTSERWVLPQCGCRSEVGNLTSSSYPRMILGTKILGIQDDTPTTLERDALKSNYQTENTPNVTVQNVISTPVKTDKDNLNLSDATTITTISAKSFIRRNEEDTMMCIKALVKEVEVCECKHLVIVEELEIRGCTLKQYHLKELMALGKKFCKIHKLIVSCTQNMSDLIQMLCLILNECRTHCISFESDDLSDENIKNICELLEMNKTVEELDMSSNREISPTGYEFIGLCAKNSNITILKVADCDLSGKSFSSLFSALDNKELKVLDLSCNQNIAMLKNGEYEIFTDFLVRSSVKRLILSGCQLNKASLDAVLEHLKKYQLEAEKETTTDEKSSKSNIQLDALDFGYCPSMESDAYTTIASIVKICNTKRLSLPGCALDPEKLKIIGEAIKEYKMTAIDFRDNSSIAHGIKDVGEIAKCLQLDEVDLSDCNLVYDELGIFRLELDNMKLKVLTLGDYGRELDENYVSEVCSILPLITEKFFLKFGVMRKRCTEMLRKKKSELQNNVQIFLNGVPLDK